MDNARYEEDYGIYADSLPFNFQPSLHRTDILCSDAANWHNSLEIQFCVKGEGFIILDAERLNFATKDIIVVNSNTIHYTGTLSDLEYACLIINADFCQQFNIDPTILTFDVLIKSDYLAEQFKELESTFKMTKNMVVRNAKLKIIVINILIELYDKHLISIENNVKKTDFEIVKMALNYIRQNYNKKITLDELSKHTLISKFTLSRDFKRFTKMTIVEYINQYRCKQAIKFLQEGKNISEAAMLCGFNNMSFFTKTFKQYIGTLPSEVKKPK